MRNKYAGLCKDCGKYVGAGKGYFEKQSRYEAVKWRVRCWQCVNGPKTLSVSLRNHDKKRKDTLTVSK